MAELRTIIFQGKGLHPSDIIAVRTVSDDPKYRSKIFIKGGRLSRSTQWILELAIKDAKAGRVVQIVWEDEA